MLRSMTGYGRGEATIGGRRIVFEIKSVNHKFFEFNSRITRGYLFLEDKLKAYVQGKISRGKVDVFLQIETLEETDVQVLVNHSLASAYAQGPGGAPAALPAARWAQPGAALQGFGYFSVHKAPEDEDAGVGGCPPGGRHGHCFLPENAGGRGRPAEGGHFGEGGGGHRLGGPGGAGHPQTVEAIPGAPACQDCGTAPGQPL